MKSKLIAVAIAGAMSCGAANAANLTLTFISSTANNIGLITTGSGATTAAVNGSIYIYTSTNDLAATDVSAVTSRAGFEALLTSPVTLRSNVAFTGGALTSSAQQELGNAGLFTYVYIQASDGSYGIYQGPNVPGVGALTLNSATMLEDLKGTSTYAVVNGVNSGFQLVAAVPEPSTMLLGALGALGLLRRRR